MDELEYWAKIRDEAELELWRWFEVIKLFDKVNQILEERR